MYFVRFRIRSLAPATSPPSICRKTAPQVGISLGPCAVTRRSPLIAPNTLSSGNLPALRFVRVVRSEGRNLRAPLAGPSPLPSTPWQAAQYEWYISLPEETEVCPAGVFWIAGRLSFCAHSTAIANADSISVRSIAVFSIQNSSRIWIAIMRGALSPPRPPPSNPVGGDVV